MTFGPEAKTTEKLEHLNSMTCYKDMLVKLTDTKNTVSWIRSINVSVFQWDTWSNSVSRIFDNDLFGCTNINENLTEYVVEIFLQISFCINDGFDRIEAFELESCFGILLL